jgi:hypothetical protein
VGFVNPDRNAHRGRGSPVSSYYITPDRSPAGSGKQVGYHLPFTNNMVRLTNQGIVLEEL